MTEFLMFCAGVLLLAVAALIVGFAVQLFRDGL